MYEIEKQSIEDIKSKIYEIRGIPIILDSDLGILYGVETKRINEAVKNNPLKFPERFCFRLTDKESEDLLVEKFDQKNETRGGKYKNPRVFTEQGALMLGTILKSKEAIQTSIDIMDAFVLIRKTLNSLTNYKKDLFLIENKLLEHDSRIVKIEEVFENFKEKSNYIFFEGQVYDAYSLLLSVFEKAKEEIIIIDNYTNHKVLDLISKLKVKVTIVSKNMSKTLIEKYRKQYNNLEIMNDNSYHDRFIIIDNKELYHFGSSIKDVGNKCFGINRIDDGDYLEKILREIRNKRSSK